MPGGDPGLNPTNSPHAVVAATTRPSGTLARLAQITFSLYLVLLLGANSQAASGGPLAWWSLWKLPTSGGDWVGVGVVSMLPPLSAAAWLAGRARAGSLRALVWRPNRVVWPLLALVGLGALSLVGQCDGGCPVSVGLRVALIVTHLAWIYVYTINEHPPPFAIVVVAVLMQATVALGQFFTQRDLGLRFLGEPPLDPAAPGISVVMRGSVRWLRAYGLTAHPNVLGGSLVALLLVLPVLGRRPTARQRTIALLITVIGFAALFAALARWAAFCFALGLAINALPALARGGASRLPPSISRATWLALALTGALLLTIYGDAVIGRATGLETPVENRSLWERSRDTRLALRLVADQPFTGVGLGQYLPEARRYDAWAEVVHNVPLWLAAELGVAGMLVWLWLVIAPVARRGALGQHAPLTALWLSFWLSGLLQPSPHPLLDLRSALLAGLVAALMARSLSPRADLPELRASDNIADWAS